MIYKKNKKEPIVLGIAGGHSRVVVKKNGALGKQGGAYKKYRLEVPVAGCTQNKWGPLKIM